MRVGRVMSTVVGAWWLLGAAVLAVEPTADELREANRFAAAKFAVRPSSEPKMAGRYSTEPPFSFVYDGRPSADLLPAWVRSGEVRRLDSQRTERTVRWSDAKTGLVVRAVAVEYEDFPTVEWTVNVKNSGTLDTPILERLQGLDVRFQRGAEGEFTLHQHTGDNCSPDSYQPHQRVLGPQARYQIASPTGRPTTGAFPYFNLAWPDEGVIVVLGWPAQWQALFARDKANGLSVIAGQELTHFRLHPGEEVRTPLVVVQFWKGDRVRSQNLWRHWMIAHNMPRAAGKKPAPILAACSMAYFGDGSGYNESGEIEFIDGFLRAGVRLDHWWIDAGWYQGGEKGWDHVGTWEPDPKRFPRGLKAVSDHAHANGLKVILWFEPERVSPGSWLAENHPEWIHGGKKGGLLDLGNPHARAWLTDHVDRFITQHGIDVYRQDFNIEPLSYWRRADQPDRQGITELRHVEGYLAFWDELRRRHPDLLIDSCASGGRRNDLETLRRAVPLLRTDYHADPAYATDNQAITYGLSSWIPYYGTGLHWREKDFFYTARSYYCPSFTLGCDVRRSDVAWPMICKAVADWRQVAPAMLGDYYPLVGYTRDPSAWMAWQFDLPQQERGVVQVFRRPQSATKSMKFVLHGLDPRATYEVNDLDRHERKSYAGKPLLEEGLSVTLAEQPGTCVLVYTRKRE